jgi:hypothetical protein
MEDNIYRSLSKGEFIPGIATSSPHMMQHPPVAIAPPTDLPPTTTTTPLEQPRVRTISGMDEVWLAELSKKQGVEKQVHVTTTTTTVTTTTMVVPVRSSLDAHGRPPLPTSASSRRVVVDKPSSFELSPEDTSRRESREDTSELAGERLLDAPITEDIGAITTEGGGTAIPRAHMRRNTGGSIYVTTTMAKPDVKNIIRVRVDV